MRMPRSLRKWLRGRKRDQVVANGRKVGQLRSIRASIDGSHPHTAADAAALDAEIERLERKRQELLDYLRTTPPY